MIPAIFRKDLLLICKQRKDIILALFFAIFMLCCPFFATDSIHQYYGKDAIFAFKAIYPTITSLIPCITFTMNIAIIEHNNNTRSFLFTQNFKKHKLVLAQNIAPNAIGGLLLIPSLIVLKVFLLPELTIVQFIILVYCGLFVSVLGCNVVLFFSNYTTRQDYLMFLSLLVSGGIYVTMSIFLFPLGPLIPVYIIVSFILLVISFSANCWKYAKAESTINFERL